MPMLESALSYAARGMHVFPVREGAKEPATQHGFLDATRDARKIQHWWRENPNYNIGIATGAVSGFSVIDVDSNAAAERLKGIMDVPTTRIIKTPRGYHLYFQYNPDIRQGANFLEGVDTRNDGGYVVAPPSVVNGKDYRIFRDEPLALLEVVPLALRVNNQHNGLAPTDEVPTWVSEALANSVDEGERNTMATRLVGYFHGKGIPEDIILQVLTPFAEKSQPPMEAGELNTIVHSVTRYPPLPSPYGVYKYISGSEKDATVGMEHYKSITDSITSITEEDHYKNITEGITALIRAWVKGTEGRWWTTDELDRELDIKTPEAKNARRVVLHRLRGERLIENHLRANKMFRTRDSSMQHMDFKNAPRNPGLDFRWPLGIENIAQLFPGNLAVIAGTQDAGKTAMMLTLIHLNQDRFPIYYFCSEMSDTDLRYRLEMFEIDINDWVFEARYRVTDFADVIEPDCVNIIDFMELSNDANMVNEYLTKIRNNLGTGIAIVGLQKKENLRKGDNYKYGKGAEGTAEKPRLYVALDKTLSGGVATIVKGKNWTNRLRNPNGLKVEYKIRDGCHFIPMGEWEYAS